MKKIEWNAGLSVGIDLVDEQHQTWIGHFNTLADAVQSGEGAGQIASLLGFLIDFTEVHFAAEEKHMVTTGYPGLEDHRVHHEELKRTLADLVQDFEEEGATQILADAMETFLGNWLVNHIENVDMKFGAYTKEQGIEL